ncbi:Lipid A core - O-antigen ligase [Variovorax sp. PBL-E5]|nr:Lipid A core - O-antigen ligase [Variovorax sp. PBL-E5]
MSLRLTEFLVALTAAAWLVPNHYLPWPAAWGDALAIIGLLLTLLVVRPAVGSVAGSRMSWQLSGVAVVCGMVIFVQFMTGKLLFAGDAVMAVLYVWLWVAAVLAGGAMVASSNRSDGLITLTGAWLFAALLSVGIALVQWTGALNLGIYAVDLPPGGRPFANVAQPNLFCTVCFLGLCGLLWLHQRQKVHDAGFWPSAVFLLLGMVMSQSRTGWLQIGLLVIWGLVLRERAGLRATRAQLLALGALFVAGALLWPKVCDALLLPAGRALNDQMRTGQRLPYWHAMLDAIGREPLWGYGWQQVGAAQQRVAQDHPIIGEYFEHSHNLILDLLLWNGVPFGGLIIGVLVWWFATRIRACQDARAAWLLAAAGGVITHGMLEYPLDYASFLIPVGLAMGAVDGLSPSKGASLWIPLRAKLLFTLMVSAVFVAVSVDYLKAEGNYRILRLESARIGTDRIVTPAVQLPVLTQLGAFLKFARTEATPGMQADQLERMRKVAERFGYPPVLFRYALALALNGQPVEAAHQIQILRHIWGDEMYVQLKEQVAGLAATKYPELKRLSLP